MSVNPAPDHMQLIAVPNRRCRILHTVRACRVMHDDLAERCPSHHVPVADRLVGAPLGAGHDPWRLDRPKVACGRLGLGLDGTGIEGSAGGDGDCARSRKSEEVTARQCIFADAAFAHGSLLRLGLHPRPWRTVVGHRSLGTACRKGCWREQGSEGTIPAPFGPASSRAPPSRTPTPWSQTDAQ